MEPGENSGRKEREKQREKRAGEKSGRNSGRKEIDDGPCPSGPISGLSCPL
jgi:hypothetical protein